MAWEDKTIIQWSPQEIDDIFSVLGTDAVLIGGQSVLLWMQYYDINNDDGLVQTRDLDFLINPGPSPTQLKDVARVVKGTVVIMDKRSMSNLIGKVFRHTKNSDMHLIDFLHNIYGDNTRRKIQDKVVVFNYNGKDVKIIHPLHLLQSKNANLYGIPEKQTPIGVRQLQATIKIVRAHIRATIAEH